MEICVNPPAKRYASAGADGQPPQSKMTLFINSRHGEFAEIPLLAIRQGQRERRR
jgi:hypothetical protein